MKTMKNIIKICMLIVAFGAFTGCTNEEAELIQKPYTYDDQYYKNIRDFKASDHSITFVYYAAWAPLEGVEGYKDPASWGERLRGLPDSLDIVNLWMGIPTKETHPIAYEDMIYCQKNLGTRFVYHADASHYRHVFTVDGQEYDMGSNSNVSDEMMDAYARYIRHQVEDAGLDGVDIDFEGWSQTNLTRLVKLLGEHWGPQGANPSKLLIVDFFSGTPSSDIEPYIDYLVKQQYSPQTGTNSSNIDNAYNQVGWCPPGKYIICEQFGDAQTGPNGGQAFNFYGETMLSIYAYARWNPAAGRKGGFGAYYVDRNYFSNSGIPYYEFRRAIQIQNPAIF